MTSLDRLNVSRETTDLLTQFSELVERWTVRINLISKASVDGIWERHVADSAQLFELAPEFEHWVDLGSGGGFPGIVIAIIAKEARPEARITLVESDLRKATFLRTAIRELGLNAKVIAERIEELPPLGADVLSARALADLPALLEFTELHLAKSGTAIFPKGQNWRKEDEAARQLWSYSLDPVKSKTSAEAAILLIKDVSRV
ncbi:16S rRNA (guanine(527)-N(7))-methyltransferase RsmG [Sulfitobacter sp. G21635-S1]|uniref:16S rRNA (guanine(527)-N(7))-methyltransferase RsmG n=1 Tax=Sulfitobacter sp. G21635-S1 TaxID=3014043 RepID=UPI0022AFD82B|nr:16S rRNA (guanine(527)-N(7))-methyltransferase RsmG [Sulfitobacter sp. G21635-S1]MCZ4255742.1 16S rRNA (guanine(527)-N(7))-methyltransferase RsmG [Sulfitobacter sp. G21635-S1]